jgi:hypothetical protein
MFMSTVRSQNEAVTSIHPSPRWPVARAQIPPSASTVQKTPSTCQKRRSLQRLANNRFVIASAASPRSIARLASLGGAALPALLTQKRVHRSCHESVRAV